MKPFVKRRLPAYMGGLLLSLGAMLVIMQAKRAFAPTFHEVKDSRPAVKVAPGALLKIIYNDEPGHYLPPGFPTRVVVAKKMPDGNYSPVIRLQYDRLVDRESILGVLDEAGEYSLNGEIYICSAPGVADCTNLILAEPIFVDAANPDKETLLAVDLPALAKFGLEAAAPAQK